MEDLVAELTLTLRNEMNAGLDEVRGEFTGLETTLQQLNTVLGDLTVALGELHVSAGLAQGFAGVDTEVQTVITSVDGIGAAIDADITKARELQTAMVDMYSAQSDMNSGLSTAGVARPVSSEQAYLNEENTGGGKGANGAGVEEDIEAGAAGAVASKVGGSFISKLFMPFLSAVYAFSGEKDFAAFQEVAIQTAMMEGMHGVDAMSEAKRIMQMSYNQAYLSRTNVDDVENAYFDLMRQKLPKPIVNEMMGPLTEAATTYATPVDEIQKTMFPLYDQFQISGEDMKQAIALLGAASHMGHYYFSDFARGIPEIGGQFAKLGDTGIAGEATAAAALEAIRRGTPDSGTAETDMRDLMTYMTSPVAVRFFDRTKRSESLLGQPILDLFKKYNVHPLDLPKFFDSETDKGIDPLDAMVDYMHSMKVQDMSATDESILFGSLFHNQQAATAMIALLQNYSDKNDGSGNVVPGLKSMESLLLNTKPGFLDENFNTAIQGDAGALSQYALLGTYLHRFLGNNTVGWFTGNEGSSQTDLSALRPGASAFNIPITLNVNVDKSGNVTASGGVSGAPSGLPSSIPAAPGVNTKINQGNVLGAP